MELNLLARVHLRPPRRYAQCTAWRAPRRWGINADCARKAVVIGTAVAARGSGERAQRRTGHRPGRAAAIVIALAAFTGSWTGFRIAGLNISDYLLVLAALLVVWSTVTRRWRLIVQWWSVIPVVVLAVYAAIGFVVFDHPLIGSKNASRFVAGTAVGDELSGALLLVARMALSLTVVALLVANYFGAEQRTTDLRRLGAWWAWGAAVSAAFAIAQHYLGVADLPFQFHIISPRANGFANHPNSLGQSVALALPILVLLTLSRRRLVRLLAIASTVLGILAVYLSGSRAALLIGTASVIVSVAYVMVKSRWRAWLLPAGAVMVAVALLVAGPILATTRFGDPAGAESTGFRLVALDTAWRWFGQSPLFGVGVASWIGEMVPLIVLTSGGIVYFLVFYGSLAVPLVRRPLCPVDPWLVILVITGLGVLAFGVLNNAIVERYLYWPLALLFAMKGFIEEPPDELKRRSLS
ncbi:O-antigen ligase family protein [Microbacterium hominis]|uniref:O-antigen ligase family protein n=1 Tax=Microbacterium hominis TaxID=162426 RepID=A0A7D4U5R4_9MICO|nr:O-antigen ligase family protein [Microbacterium hominis]QKJ20265.1 O-antigen ligase family protein [Microbacterium hominis]